MTTRRQKLIDAAIHKVSGVVSKFSAHVYIGELNDFVTTASVVERARELGYINGYRWGVEYPTDGKKPNLPDDVVIRLSLSMPRGALSVFAGSAMYAAHGSSFVITDERYKPADTGYLNACTVEHLAHTKTTDTTIEFESVKTDGEFAFDALKQGSSDWYDYENQKAIALPPVGVECEANNGGNTGYFSCVVVAYHFKSGRPILRTKNSPIYSLTEAPHCWNFRPLDWNRKAEAERKRVVDAAYNAIAKPTGIGVDKALYELYELGYLRMPVDKD